MQVNLSKLLQKTPPFWKKTKMTCTIGPTSDNVELLKQLLHNGMNVCRINFSHDDHEVHYRKLQRIREAIASNPLYKHTAIMLDTKGPEIRTGMLSTPKINLVKKNKIVLTSDYTVKGTPDLLALSYEHLARDVKVGSKILLADGNLSLLVLEINHNEKTVVAEILNDFILGENKNVNLPGVKVDLPVISEKDRIDLVEFGLKHDVDMIALSFTRSAKCIKMCKDTLGEQGKHIKIIPKIENQEGLENLNEIMSLSDGVMIARGDLGMEMEPSKLFLAQNYITEVARYHGKPIVMATQMLESMTSNSRPTRAEITDVGSSVWNLNDATMLSGETGNGKFPVESVQIMADICRETEFHLDYEQNFRKSELYQDKNYALARAAVELSFSLVSKVIIVTGEKEIIASQLSAFRPAALIFYVHHDARVLRGLQLNFGVFGIQQPKLGTETQAGSIKAVKHQLELMGLKRHISSAVFVNGDTKEIKIIS